MDILLNGAPGLSRRLHRRHLLAENGLVERRVAVEVNGSIVPRSAHPQHALREGDRVEIVHALGGG